MIAWRASSLRDASKTTNSGSPKTVAASSKLTPCLRRFFRLFSHSTRRYRHRFRAKYQYRIFHRCMYFVNTHPAHFQNFRHQCLQAPLTPRLIHIELAPRDLSFIAIAGPGNHAAICSKEKCGTSARSRACSMVMAQIFPLASSSSSVSSSRSRVSVISPALNSM